MEITTVNAGEFLKILGLYNDDEFFLNLVLNEENIEVIITSGEIYFNKKKYELTVSEFIGLVGSDFRGFQSVFLEIAEFARINNAKNYEDEDEEILKLSLFIDEYAPIGGESFMTKLGEVSLLNYQGFLRIGKNVTQLRLDEFKTDIRNNVSLSKIFLKSINGCKINNQTVDKRFDDIHAIDQLIYLLNAV